ncbi:unnamed protein product [Blepharisma stoltei]|uniref:Uncharacterized protein n=1 Tax=Blepharisma stoltei TaxID=1481888 RepID=A0AAU9IZ56_9CILI|nr:unnamed protein product [Blepharisma stoltei]
MISLKTKEKKLKEVAANSVLKISKICNENEQTHLLAVILNLIGDEDFQALAIEILGKLCDGLDISACETFILPEVLRLCRDSHLNVKKKAIKTLGILAGSVSLNAFISDIYPLYLYLCTNENWSVRKICASILGEIASKANFKAQKTTLLETYYLLLWDSVLMVKQAARSQIGRFLYETRSNDALILKELINLISDQNESSIETMKFLPSIFRNNKVKEEWMIDRIIQISNSSNSIVRGSLVGILKYFSRNCSHESLKEIIPIFKDLLRDVDLVKIKAIKILPDFLQHLDLKDRIEFLSILRRIQMNQVGIRIKKSLGKILKDAAKLFPNNITIEKIWPIITALLNDKNTIVRQVSSFSIGAISELLWNSSQNFDEEIQKFFRNSAGSESYQFRLNFVWSLRKIKNISCFGEWLLNIFYKLCEDSIISIRIACAQHVKIMLGRNNLYIWKRAAFILNSDPEWDVIYFLKENSQIQKKKKFEYSIIPPKRLPKLNTDPDWELVYASNTDSSSINIISI